MVGGRGGQEIRRGSETGRGTAIRDKTLADEKTEEANTQKRAALAAEGEAVRQADRAGAKEKEALEARQVAEHQARLARARELAATALPMVRASDQSELAVLLGMHAVATTYAGAGKERCPPARPVGGRYLTAGSRRAPIRRRRRS